MKTLGLGVATTALALVLFTLPSAAAEGLDRGSTVFSLQITHGTADLIAPELGGGSVTAYDHSEWGGRAQLQRLISESWAFAASVGINTFKETNEPGTNAPSSATDFEYTQSSFAVRVGADRFVHISPTFHLFVGPGVHFWSGKASFEGGSFSSKVDSERTTRVALDGRIGAHIGLSESVGVIWDVGHYVGRASGDDAGAKASWWPSGSHGSLGIAFDF